MMATLDMRNASYRKALEDDLAQSKVATNSPMVRENTSSQQSPTVSMSYELELDQIGAGEINRALTSDGEISDLSFSNSGKVTEREPNGNSQRADAQNMIDVNRTFPKSDCEIVSTERKFSTTSGGEYGGSEPPPDERQTWGKKMDFLLSIIGFAVDLANVWRFPYLCYRNGGGAFLIPYFMMLIFGAAPLFYMELLLGQFHREGAVTLWKIAPLFKGIGWGVVLISFTVATYYNVIIGWAFYYLFTSFSATLPWSGCGNEWNTCYCWDGNDNVTECNNMTVNSSTGISASAEYFDRALLGMHQSVGIGDVGLPRLQIALCVLCVFLILYLSLWKGVHSSGKVVWITATAPYIILSILFVNGLCQEGAVDGIIYFIVPRFDRLGDPKVWIDAAFQIFYSVGAGFGVHLAFASYNKFHNNCYKDFLITVGMNSFTSIFSGFVIFSYLGYLSVKNGVDIDKVATEGAGLVFVVYPEAIATLPVPQLWAVIFFIMLITLGLDSSMGGLEAVMTGLKDQLKVPLKKLRYGREILTGILVGSAFLLSIASTTYGGIYVLTMLDTFAAGTSLLFAVFIEAVGVAWLYGLNQFNEDARQMLGFTPGIFWRVCWKFISPFFVLAIITISAITYLPLTYQGYIYPDWANVLGWLIAGSSMVLLPLVAIFKLITAKGKNFSQKLAVCISPEWEHESILKGEEVERFKLRHWTAI